jgi:hypothetical protein
LLAAAPAAFAQSGHPNPAPVLVAPADGREIPPPMRAVTIKVKALPGERAGSLGIQLTDADGTVDREGRYRAEGGIDDYPLEAVAPGSADYTVTVPADAFRRYGDKHLFWQAYRLVEGGDCRPISGSTMPDCFQESAGSREFTLLEPTGYLSYEPNDTRATASTDFFPSDCAYLEKRSDVDWYRYNGAARPVNLRFRLSNLGDTDRWVPLQRPSRESAAMAVRVYLFGRTRAVAAQHVPVGTRRVLKTRLAANKVYFIAIKHAGNGFPRARPAANLYYRFASNLPSEFDFAGCG